MEKAGAAALAITLLVAACAGVGGHGTSEGPFAPGADARGEAVDGLIVGHRMLAAGEYELALKAYYRAAADHGVTVDVLSAVGSANLHLGRLGQAELYLRRALERDQTFVPAWNNLGVVLMEKGDTGEAVESFRRAFALDSGESADIRNNLRLALARLEVPGYAEPDNNFALVRRGSGRYLLLSER